MRTLQEIEADLNLVSLFINNANNSERLPSKADLEYILKVYDRCFTDLVMYTSKIDPTLSESWVRCSLLPNKLSSLKADILMSERWKNK